MPEDLNNYPGAYEKVRCAECDKLILCELDKSSECSIVIKCRCCKEKNLITAEGGIITTEIIK